MMLQRIKFCLNNCIYIIITIICISCQKDAEEYTVKYISDYGESPTEFVCDDGFILTDELLPELKQDGMVFKGWYDEDGNKILAENYSVRRDITLIANWEFLLRLSYKGVYYKPFLIQDGIMHYNLPNSVDFTKLVMNVNEEVQAYFDGMLHMNNSEIDFSDFTISKKYVFNFKDGSKEEFEIIVYDLPVLIINTPNNEQITSKDNRVEGCELFLIEGNSIDDLGTAGIKVRGNFTATCDKKPYNVKFDKITNVFGMPKSKKWVLLSNPYIDRTQMHNAVAFEVARYTDYEWVQSGRFVELVLNGEHRGLYYLCEKIDIGNNKINIPELTFIDVDSVNITGGYLLEPRIDWQGYTFESDYFKTTGTLLWSYKWCLKSPDVLVQPEQIDYIRNAVNNMESLIWYDDKLMTGEYREYLDIETVINWFLVEELCANEEASRTKNLYMYKNRGDEKFYIGPPWDFDAYSFGDGGYGRFFTKECALYYKQLFKDDFFCNRVRAKWNAYKNLWREQIPAFIDNLYSLISKAAKRNEKIWSEWENTWYNSNDMTYEQLIFQMKYAYIQQWEFLDKEINNL